MRQIDVAESPTGRLEPTVGEVQRPRGLVIGRYDQHFDELLPLDDLNSRVSAAAHLVNTFGVKDQDARALRAAPGWRAART